MPRNTGRIGRIKGKNIRCKWTSKFMYPMDIYKGNCDHFAIKSMEAEELVARGRLKQEEQGIIPDSDKLTNCYIGFMPYLWTREKVLALDAGAKSFKQLVDEYLAPEMPGSLYKDPREAYWKKNLTELHQRALDNRKHWYQDTRRLCGGSTSKPVRVPDFSQYKAR